ncbi:MAG: UvrD-helicase domain-containing protein, partial [Bdellovibrionales bacterium]|nr:UvrD-helicase domain-containing protein [Bdellovibrionales bacterium]
MNLQNYLEQKLNSSQFQAVKSLSGPLLVLAGAGSGKTRVLTYRIANLIAQGEAAPGEILAVTFTNKAAREMAVRTYSILEELGIPIYQDLWISTFHSTCARILRDKIHLLEYQPFFVIYDDADQLSMIKKVMNQLEINDKVYPPKA